ncbi:UV radiation resistance protein and autophagy-related subunit 14-domain-containing protein [Zopfochytrium polystomum]|nr:UV radiation resistance protein and autophagy-related subunit 14-domain-containing protein [Zopfochytrium polystomum]
MVTRLTHIQSLIARNLRLQPIELSAAPVEVPLPNNVDSTLGVPADPGGDHSSASEIGSWLAGVPHVISMDEMPSLQMLSPIPPTFGSFKIPLKGSRSEPQSSKPRIMSSLASPSSPSSPSPTTSSPLLQSLKQMSEFPALPDGFDNASSPPQRRLSRKSSSSSLLRLSMSSQLLMLERYARTAKVYQRDLLDSFFTLSWLDVEDATPFYTSEICPCSMNPSWLPIDDWDPPDYVAQELNISRFLLRIWARPTLFTSPDARFGVTKLSEGDGPPWSETDASSFRIILSLPIDLRKLAFMCKDFSTEDTKSFPPNTVIFKLTDGLYSYSPNTIVSMDEDLPTVKVESGKVKNSYRLEQIQRLLSLLNDVRTIRRETLEIMETAENQNESYQPLQNGSQQKVFQSRLRLVEKEIMSRSQDIQSNRVKLDEAKDLLQEKRKLLVESGVSRDRFRLTLYESQKSLERQKTEFSLLIKDIAMKQKSVLTDLTGIYNIKQAKAELSVCSIRGIWLPNAEFSGSDDERISTALGFVAHLVSIMARYLEVPLRYPLNPMSSRSTILDRVSKVHIGGREFPLYQRGVDKPMFEYGVFLLNKNIEQLMNFVGLNVSNLRNTLSNILQLIQAIQARHESHIQNTTGSPQPPSASSSTSTLPLPLAPGQVFGGRLFPTVSTPSPTSAHGPASNQSFLAGESPIKLLKLPLADDGDTDTEQQEGSTCPPLPTRSPPNAASVPSHLDDFMFDQERLSAGTAEGLAKAMGTFETEQKSDEIDAENGQHLDDFIVGTTPRIPTR